MVSCSCTSVLACVLFFFFFQAEDGIRDVAVTGVQTCALPILRQLDRRIAGGRAMRRSSWRISWPASRSAVFAPIACPPTSSGGCSSSRRCGTDRKSVGEGKRVDLGGRRIIKKKNNEEREVSRV